MPTCISLNVISILAIIQKLFSKDTEMLGKYYQNVTCSNSFIRVISNLFRVICLSLYRFCYIDTKEVMRTYIFIESTTKEDTQFTPTC